MVTDPVLEDMLHRRDLWRAEFERLLAGGATREEANANLCARIDAGERPPGYT